MKFTEMPLSEWQAEQIEGYRKSNDNKYAEYVVKQFQADNYIQEIFEKVPEQSKYSSSNCWHEGHSVYRRKDGLPITQDDIDVLNTRVFGQTNIVRGNVGDMTIAHDWVCDSSD